MTATRGKGAKTKGYIFEKTCCRLLSNWYGKTFLRVPQSGGWADNVVKGDVFPINEDNEVDLTFPFSVECKSQEGWELYQFLINKGPFGKWWRQCTCDTPEGKQPLLLFKKSHSPTFAVIRSEILSTPSELLMVDRPALQRSCYAFREGLICFTWESFCLIFKPVHPLRESDVKIYTP